MSVTPLQLRLRLHNLGARLSDRLFRAGNGRLGDLHGRRRRFLGFHGLRVLELRDLVLRRQRLVAVDVILGLQVIGFRLPERGLCGVKLPLSGNQPGFEILHVSGSAGEFTRRVYGGDGNIGLQSGSARSIIGQSRIGIRQCDLVVFGVELHQDCSRLDIPIVVHHDAGYVAANPRTEGVNVTIDLRVIGGFPRGIVAIQQNRNHDESETQQE